MYYMNIYSYVYIGSSPYIKATYTMQGDDKIKLYVVGCVDTQKNKYTGVGSLRKIKNTITNKIRTKKFLRRNLVFKYQKLVFKYQNKQKEQMFDF